MDDGCPAGAATARQAMNAVRSSCTARRRDNSTLMIGVGYLFPALSAVHPFDQVRGDAWARGGIRTSRSRR
jgi:hypothetical protein